MNSTFCKFNYLQDIGDFYPKILPHYLADIDIAIGLLKKDTRLLVVIILKLNGIQKAPESMWVMK